MRIHFSIDDVTEALNEICKKSPMSIFDIPFWNNLKQWNIKYGVVFTLYIFPKDKEEYICRLPSKYYLEMEKANFIKLGYHGYRRIAYEENLEMFKEEFIILKESIPFGLLTNKLRLHRYMASKDMIKFLKKSGIQEIFCRDKESARRLGTGPSYDLNESEREKLRDGSYCKNGIVYTETDIQIELYNEDNLIYQLNNKFKGNELIVFTHEKCIYENSELLELTFIFFNSKNVKYIH